MVQSCTTGGDSAASTQPITAALTIPPTNQSHRDSFPMNIYTVTDGLSAFRSNIFNRPPRRAFHSRQHICRSRTFFRALPPAPQFTTTSSQTRLCCAERHSSQVLQRRRMRLSRAHNSTSSQHDRSHPTFKVTPVSFEPSSSTEEMRLSRAPIGTSSHHDRSHPTQGPAIDHDGATRFKPNASTEEDAPFASSQQYKLTTRPKSPDVQGYPGPRRHVVAHNVIQAKFFDVRTMRCKQNRRKTDAKSNICPKSRLQRRRLEIRSMSNPRALRDVVRVNLAQHTRRPRTRASKVRPPILILLSCTYHHNVVN